MYVFEGFKSWSAVLGYADRGKSLWYHAPFDTRPVPVTVRRIYKNGKIRLDSGETVFTADSSHLGRFRRLCREGDPPCVQSMGCLCAYHARDGEYTMPCDATE